MTPINMYTRALSQVTRLSGFIRNWCKLGGIEPHMIMVTKLGVSKAIVVIINQILRFCVR